jgi:hypothetical protein
MSKRKHRNETSPKDIAAFTKNCNKGLARPALPDSERNDELLPKPLVKIVNYRTGRVTQASLGATPPANARVSQGYSPHRR